MTKKEIIKNVYDIMSGKSGHTYIIFGKKNGKWTMDTNISSYFIYLNDYSDWDWITEEKYCCNNITFSEIINIVDEAINYNQ